MCGSGKIVIYAVCFRYIFFFFKEKTAYEVVRGLVGSEMFIRGKTMGGGVYT